MASSSDSTVHCIGFDFVDATRQCLSVTMMTPTMRFCSRHSTHVRKHYVRYKQLTEQMSTWHQRLLVDNTSSCIDTLKKFYGLLAHVGTLREKFTQTWVHPSCRDRGHEMFTDKLSTIKASVEKRLRAAFLLAHRTADKKKKKATCGNHKACVVNNAHEDNVMVQSIPHKIDLHSRQKQQKQQKRQEEEEEADISAYLQRCITENSSKRIERMLEASQAYRRAFFQVWLWLERNKLLSGTLVKAYYDKQIAWASDAPFPVTMDTVKEWTTHSFLIGGQLINSWRFHPDEEGSDPQDTKEMDALGRELDPFLRMLCSKAIMPLGEFAQPNQPTIARTVHLVILGLLNWFQGICALRDSRTGNAPVGDLSLLWCVSSCLTDQDYNLDKWIKIGSRACQSDVAYFQRFITFSDALDAEMQLLNLHIVTNVGGSPDHADGLPRILNMPAARLIAIKAARQSQTSVIRATAPAALYDVSRLVLDAQNKTHISKHEENQLEHAIHRATKLCGYT
jgi:hypothetical protein